MDIEIRVCHANEIPDWLEPVANLRITQFREFPYLYVGSKVYEIPYLKTYAEHKHGVFVLAFHKNQLIGVATGAALEYGFANSPELFSQFRAKDLNPTEFYYYGEFIILPDYRYKGIFQKLFAKISEEATNFGYKRGCLMTVVREANHPLGPEEYTPPDRVWKKVGFEPTDITISFNWPTLLSNDEVKETQNQMLFWIK